MDVRPGEGDGRRKVWKFFCECEEDRNPFTFDVLFVSGKMKRIITERIKIEGEGPN